MRRQTDRSLREDRRPEALREERRPADPLLEVDLLGDLLEAIRFWEFQAWLRETARLDLGIDFTLVGQVATDVEEGDQALLSGSYQVFFEWTAFEDTAIGAGSLGVLLDGGGTIGASSNEDLSANIGSSIGVNGDLDLLAFRGGEVWWRQALDEPNVDISIGRLDQTVYFDTNRFANDENTEFLSAGLVNNPAIPFPDNGWGLNVVWTANDHLYLTAGGGDALADADAWDFKSLEEGKFFVAGEVGLRPSGTVRDGTWRLLLWHNETENASGAGLAVSIDQLVAQNLAVFFRYGIGDDDVTLFRQSISGGLVIDNPFGRRSDSLGLGAVWAQPADRSLRTETILEAIYKIQLTPSMQFSPDVQIVFDPTFGRESVVAVFGARMHFVF